MFLSLHCLVLYYFPFFKQPIAEIGSSVGYDNPLHFSRAFKNTLGISPSEYRKEYRIFTDQ